MPGLGERLSAAKRLRDPRVAALVLAGAFGLLLLLTGAAFLFDQALTSGKVARNVSVGGRDVSAASKTRLADVLVEVDQRYATTEVLVADSDKESDSFTTDAGTIGLRVDPRATAERVMAVGRQGSLPGRWWSWLSSFRGTRRSDVALSVDRAAVTRVIAEKAKDGDDPPTEASIQLDRNGRFVGVGGKAGQGIDPGELSDDLAKAAKEGTPIKVKIRRGGLGPRFTKTDADRLAQRAESLVTEPLPLAAGTTTANLSIGTLRSLLSSAPGPTELELQVDEAAATISAEKALSAAGNPAVEPTFKIEANDAITLVPGTAGRGCCGPDAGKAVAAAILQRPPGPVQLTLVDKKPKLTNEQAAGLGVKEQVSTFSTRHACCQPRVTNIHRIADIVRGQVIPPGQTFSINEFVGPRTAEKGFVVDHVIEDGRFAEDVGGGVSQFATTLFNASWFAGLEFGEYQSHSLYIPRYPKGRDATLGFPHPDLVIKNPSPYGVLIWPTYTDTSLTVALYSTHWDDVTATGQDTQSNGSCTVYLAKRQRTFLDGRVVNDATKAQYRANEGQNCIDAQAPPDTTTTKVGAPTTPTTMKPPPPTTTTKKPAPATTIKK